MRTLRIVVRTASGTLPLVVAASVSCGESEHTGPPGSLGTAGVGAGAGMMGGGGAGTGGGGVAGKSGGTGGISFGGQGGTLFITGGSAGAGAGGIIVGEAGSGAGGEASSCDPFCPAVRIALPEEGTPAAPGQICAATLEPVTSNRAATFRFTQSGSDFTRIDGVLVIAPELRERIVGVPVVEVLDATSEDLAALTLGPLEVGAEGFVFSGTWPASVLPSSYDVGRDITRLTMRASLEVSCEDGTRLVHAVSDVHLCSVEGSADWATSGDSCCVCRVIAEMAPSPIVPEAREDELPLAQALRLRIVELARVSNTVVLLAENDGGEGLEYEWLASVGRIDQLAPDVIAWTLADGDPDPFIQAAVSGPHAAAVASFAFNDRAA